MLLMKKTNLIKDFLTMDHHYSDDVGWGTPSTEIIGNIYENPELLKNE